MAATTQQHNMIYRVLGAAKTVADNTRVARSLMNLRRIGSQFQAGLQGMAGLMIGFAGSLVAVGLALRRTVSAYAEYTMAQARMRTLMALSVENYRLHSRLAGDLAEQVGIRLGYSLTEANDAMTTLLETGLGTHASMRIFQVGMQLARVGMMETADANQFLVDSINLFRNEMVGPDGASMELRRFAELTAGRLAISAARSATSIDQMRQAFRYAATTMEGFGMTSTDTMAAVAGLASIGIRGSQAGTSMRQFMLQLRDPSERVRDRLAEITGNTNAWGEITHTATGESRTFIDSLQQLYQVFGRLTTEQEREELAAMMFGSRSINVGLSIAGWNTAARQMVELTGELADETQVLTGFQRANEQSMMSFGMQMEQLKLGADDLAIAFGEILFGAMDTTGEGFGTYVREIARAIRLLGRSDREATAEFAAFSPRVREAAQNIREFFINVADLLRLLWRMGAWIADFTAKHPALVASIIAVRLAFGGTTQAVSGLLRGMQLLGRQSITWAQGAAVPAAAGAQMLRGAITLLAVDLAGRATRALQDWTIGLMDARGEMEQIHRTTVAMYSDVGRGIPIVGGLVSQYLELIGVMQEAWRVAQEQLDRQSSTYQRTVGASATQRVEEYASNSRQRMTRQGMNEFQIQTAAVSRVQAEATRELATMLKASGVQGERTTRESLSNLGLGAEDISRMMPELVRLQASMTQEMAQREASTMATPGLFGPNLNQGLRESIRQLNELPAVLRQIADAARDFRGPGMVDSAVGTGEMLMAEDAYVQRGGLMSVSSGDVVVSRRHLADAILASRGTLAGPAVGMSSERTMAGPTPSAPTGGGEFNVTVPVSIDGREIARAVGRAEVRQLERGGARLQPGQRRSLRETGFNRSV